MTTEHRVLPTLGLGVCLLLAAPHAQAGETKPFICVEVSGAVAGVDADGLAAAIRLEARKADAEVAVRVVGERAPCPSRGRLWVRVGPGPDAVIAGAERSTSVPLERLGERERMAELAWAVIDFGVPTLDGGDEPIELFDTDDEVWVPEPAADVSASIGLAPDETASRTSGVELWAEGGYGFQPQATSHRGHVGGEVTASFFGGRLALGLAGGYQAAATLTTSALELSVTSGELLGVARGGVLVGPVLLRLGLQAGWQWCTLEAHASSRVDELGASSGAAVLGGDLEAAWSVSDHFLIGLALRGRGYLGGADYSFAGELVSPAPAGELGVVLRLGVSLWP